MFVVKVRGRSMEPKIPDGSWCLFRKCPPGSREGKIVLVQFSAMGDVETGGRYTVKKYHSEKAVTEDSWAHQHIQLLPLNSEYRPIEVEPQEAEQMVVVGEFIGVL
jgi:SOS-response transcriptional repressor LexA